MYPQYTLLENNQNKLRRSHHLQRTQRRAPQGAHFAPRGAHFDCRGAHFVYLVLWPFSFMTQLSFRRQSSPLLGSLECRHSPRVRGARAPRSSPPGAKLAPGASGGYRIMGAFEEALLAQCWCAGTCVCVCVCVCVSVCLLACLFVCVAASSAGAQLLAPRPGEGHLPC